MPIFKTKKWMLRKVSKCQNSIVRSCVVRALLSATMEERSLRDPPLTELRAMSQFRKPEISKARLAQRQSGPRRKSVTSVILNLLYVLESSLLSKAPNWLPTIRVHSSIWRGLVSNIM